MNLTFTPDPCGFIAMLGAVAVGRIQTCDHDKKHAAMWISYLPSGVHGIRMLSPAKVKDVDAAKASLSGYVEQWLELIAREQVPA